MVCTGPTLQASLAVSKGNNLPRQAHALGKHLDVPSISYALALLRLPQLYMATYFVRGVETMSELQISLRRLNAFLALPEPPAPVHLQAQHSKPDDPEKVQQNLSLISLLRFT